MARTTKRKILGGQFEVQTSRFFIGQPDEVVIRMLYDRRWYDQMRRDGFRGGFGIEPKYIGEFDSDEAAETAAAKILADEEAKKSGKGAR